MLNITNSFIIMEKVAPEDNTASDDCESINTLKVTFFLEMTYCVTDPVETFNKIIAFPFSKKRLQKSFRDCSASERSVFLDEGEEV